MRRIEIAIDARLEVAGALAVSYRDFGLAAAERYRVLIQQAYRDLAENPTRTGVSTRPDIPADLRLYPIRHSRARVPAPTASAGPATSSPSDMMRRGSRSCICCTTAWICRGGWDEG